LRLSLAAFALLLVVVSVHAEGDMLFLNENGSSSVSQLSLRVIPGQQNSTSFRVVAQNDNISSLAFFAFSQDLNVTLSPANRTSLVQGDFQLVTVTASVSNQTQAGTRLASIIVLTTKPQQLLLPLIVEIPSTTEWNATPGSLTKNVTVGEFGVLNITLTNTGNVPISGHVSVVDLRGLVYFDASDFLLFPGAPVTRPLYYFIPPVTPGTYAANITFVDALNQARRVGVSFILPDITPPTGNVTLARSELFPGQDVLVSALIRDDVNVSAVRWRLGTGNVSEVGPAETGRYEFELRNLSVGSHDLVVLANDTSGNLAALNLSFVVKRFQYLTALPEVHFLRFRPGQTRQLPLLNAITPTPVTLTLESLSVGSPANDTLQVLANGNALVVGSPVRIEASGDVLMAIQGTNLTTFSGTLRVETDPTVENPVPLIRFDGEIANYSVTPPFNVTLPGFQSSVSCTPRDDGALESSSIDCTARFPVDTPQENIGVIGSPASLQAERQGYQTRIDTHIAERNSEAIQKWVLFIVILLAAAGALVNHFFIQRTDMGDKVK
jgi:uncharacterized repeat protein (TIGR01451 family)